MQSKDLVNIQGKIFFFIWRLIYNFVSLFLMFWILKALSQKIAVYFFGVVDVKVK
jgi:hypothetical protein